MQVNSEEAAFVDFLSKFENGYIFPQMVNRGIIKLPSMIIVKENIVSEITVQKLDHQMFVFILTM